MPKYTKKPVTVDAIQWTGENVNEVRDFIRPIPSVSSFHPGPDGVGEVWVAKSEMYAVIRVGMWFIAERDGIGVYPCTAEEFAEGFDEVFPYDVGGMHG